MVVEVPIGRGIYTFSFVKPHEASWGTDVNLRDSSVRLSVDAPIKDMLEALTICGRHESVAVAMLLGQLVAQCAEIAS